MTRVLEFRLGELLGIEPRCDHLADEELIGLVEGGLLADRLEAYRQHAGGCVACTALLDDVETFRQLTADGVTIPSELKAFREADRRIRRRLGLSPRRWRMGSLALWLVPAITVAALAVMVWQSPPWRQDDQLLISDVQAVALVPPATVRTEDLSRIWSEAELAWNEQRFGDAARLLASGAEVSPDNASLWFYLGHAQLLDGNPAEALAALERADALDGDIPSEHTRWMLAATLERLDRRDEACAALRSVGEIGGSRAANARRIVEDSCPDTASGQSAP